MAGLANTLALVATLRSPQGCPWDRSLTLATMREHFIEEAYEVAAAAAGDDDGKLIEELGDLLMLILMQAQIASEDGRFDLAAIAAALNDKLIRRHPHVFGSERAESPDDAVRIWQAVKAQERGIDDGDEAPRKIPGYLPALKYAREQIAIDRGGSEPGDAPSAEFELEHDLAERLYRLVEECDELGVDAETALRSYAEGLDGRSGD